MINAIFSVKKLQLFFEHSIFTEISSCTETVHQPDDNSDFLKFIYVYNINKKFDNLMYSGVPTYEKYDIKDGFAFKS